MYERACSLIHTLSGTNLRTLVRTAFVAMGLAFTLMTPSTVLAQATHLRVSNSEMGSVQRVDIGQNKSLIIDFPTGVGEVIVSQPEVATAIMRSKRRAIVQGVNHGETNIFFLDSYGRTISVLELAVKSAPSRVAKTLEDTIARVVPGSNIEVQSVILEGGNSEVNRVVLSGTALSSDDINKATTIATQFAGGPDNVASVVSVQGSQQVSLKVTVAEVNREIVKQLGINLSASVNTGNLSSAIVGSQALGGASGLVSASGASLGLNAGAFSLNATLRALERRGAARTLAEPTLTAMSGEEAKFLAGGEFPLPTGYDPTNNTVTFEFKKFGVELNFTPTVKTGGEIALQVLTRVTEPTTEGGYAAGPVNIPAVNEREASTFVQLPSGSTFAIAGLYQERARQQINELPGLSKLPILGALFRSRDFIRSQTELVILVTPVITYPSTPDQLPTDRLQFASDAETIFLGRMEALYGVGGNKGDANYKGSVGFVLD